MLLCWHVSNKVLGTLDMMGGLTNQWLKYFGEYLCQSVGNISTAGHYRPDGVPGLWILLEGRATCKLHGHKFGQLNFPQFH